MCPVQIEERPGGETVFCGEKIDSDAYQGRLWPHLKQKMLSHGPRTALVNPYTGKELTYNEVVSLAECLSRGLFKLGLRQGRSLCIFAPNSVENVLLNLATLATGAIVHGTNPSSVPDEMRRQFQLTGVKIIVTIPRLLAAVREAVAGNDVLVIIIGPRDDNVNYEDILILGSSPEHVTVPPITCVDPENSIVSLLFSSGTTGLPKAVELTEFNEMAWIHIYSVFDGGPLGPTDTVVKFLPLYHSFGQAIALMPCLAFGVRLVIMEKFQIDDFLTFCSRYKATMLFIVPPVILAIINHPRLSDFDLSSLRFVMSGAAPLGKETEAEFVAKTGAACFQGFGMTECLVATLNCFSRNRRGSSGIPVPNTEFKIVDSESKKSLGVNQIGDLYMRGPMVMRGYHKDPQATNDAKDSQGWFDTGDVGFFDSDAFLYIVDRRKELIKFKGEQVAPAQLEDVLLSHPSVADACVVGRPDLLAGELPMAFVVLSPGCSLTAQQVQDFVASKVPSYMQLRGGVEFRQEIPKSPSGKLLRRLLRDELKQSQQRQAKL